MKRPIPLPVARHGGLLRRLARDRAGNTLALLAAAILPLLGLVGGGVDMGRAYMAESRLQQACDAGVLAARKKLGTSAPVTGNVPQDVGEIGQRFFNVNFRQNAYGTANRTFTMTLNPDYSISGRATVDVPTSVMTIFGFSNVPVAVECQSRLDFSKTETDIMMVLDVTGSMRWANPGDSLSRLDSLKAVIHNFYQQLGAAQGNTDKIRMGFVPYATNVNVGDLLQDSWVAKSWTYQTRVDQGKRQPAPNKVTNENWQYAAGTRSDWATESSYAGTYHAPPSPDQGPWYSCDGSQPSNTWTFTDVVESTDVKVKLDPKGIETIEYIRRTSNGKRYRTIISGTTCEIQSSIDTAYVETYERHTFVPSFDQIIWYYTPWTYDVSDWRTWTTGCIEERATYPITDYSKVDLTKALDLDLDTVPNPAKPATQWGPQKPDIIWVRAVYPNGGGAVSVPHVRTVDDFADTGNWWFSDCPSAKARKLQHWDPADLDAYLNTLRPFGATYHDIGMIWGGRLISPTGLFAAENQPAAGNTKERHLIFLTDGQTEPYDIAYGAYGVDALDQRRWDPSSPNTLTKTVEERFKFACNEVKKRNVTVWVIAFGTSVNQSMVDCAGEGHYFEAANAGELADAFTTISSNIADLRLSK